MKPKPPKPHVSVSDTVYTAINQLDGGSEQQVMKRALKLGGETVTLAQFKRALASFDYRGVARGNSHARRGR